jgi:hypothetical protein
LGVRHETDAPQVGGLQKVNPEDGNEIRRLAKAVEKIDTALFAPGADGDPPMIQRIAAVVHAAERGEWVAKWGIRAILAAGALAAAFAALRGELGVWIKAMFTRV